MEGALHKYQTMRINELLSDRDNLDEASLRDLARAGVLGAGLIGAGLGTNSLATKAPSAPAAVTQPAQATAAADVVTEPKAAPTSQKTQDNPNFPAALKGLDSKDATTRVNTFKQVVLPLIDRENAEIKKQTEAGIQVITFSPEDGRKFRAAFYDNMWEAAVQKAPQTAPALKALLYRP